MLENFEKLWNLKATEITIVIDSLSTVTKRLIKGLEDLKIRGRVKTIQTIALLIWPEYYEESWRVEVTCSHSVSWGKPSANAEKSNAIRTNQEDLEVGGREETSKQLHHWELPEYWKEFWRVEETCCHSDSSETIS